MATESIVNNEWISALTSAGSDKIDQIGFMPFLILMLFSLVGAYAVTLLYLTFFSRRSSGSEAYRAFPLLGISVTAIFVCIQFSLPLSLGLLGALSIVRFRTPIKEPEEIGFIMLVIALALACATFQFLFVGVVLIVAIIGLIIAKLLYDRIRPFRTGTLILRMSEEDYIKGGEKLLSLLRRELSKAELECVSASDGHSVLTYAFKAPTSGGLQQLIENIRKDFPMATLNAYFDQPRPV